MQKVNVLGTEYTIIDRSEKEDRKLKEHDGYCDSSTKTIVILKHEEDPMNKEDMNYLRQQILRHEIIHAFLSESGIEACGNSFGGSWAQNEEMVDWIALQFPKMLQTFIEAKAINLLGTETWINHITMDVDKEKLSRIVQEHIDRGSK